MYFLLSGEGETDMGLCVHDAKTCEGCDHHAGPMAIMVSQIVEQYLGFSFIETGYYAYVSKSTLVERASVFKKQKKAIRLPGRKKPKETGYFYRNARALAACAKDSEARLQDPVVAVLFRDSDGTASMGRGIWRDKRNSMIRGFGDETFQRGVPMIPKPKSEAWIICAVKQDPYQGCSALEDRSGNDSSPNSLKGELAEILDGSPSRYELCEMVTSGKVNVNQIDMPSFRAFRERLERIIRGRSSADIE